MTPVCPTQVRVVLPLHLRRLAGVSGEVRVRVDPPVTLGKVLDAVERDLPVLCGAIRDRDTGRRRPFVRFFAGERDYSHDGYDVTLPEAVAGGTEPLLVVGAMAGG